MSCELGFILKRSTNDLQAVERSLHPLLSSIVISPSLVQIIVDTEVDDSWIPAVTELDAKLGAIRSGPRLESRKTLDEAAESLRVKVRPCSQFPAAPSDSLCRQHKRSSFTSSPSSSPSPSPSLPPSPLFKPPPYSHSSLSSTFSGDTLLDKLTSSKRRTSVRSDGTTRRGSGDTCVDWRRSDCGRWSEWKRLGWSCQGRRVRWVSVCGGQASEMATNLLLLQHCFRRRITLRLEDQQVATQFRVRWTILSLTDLALYLRSWPPTRLSCVLFPCLCQLDTDVLFASATLSRSPLPVRLPRPHGQRRNRTRLYLNLLWPTFHPPSPPHLLLLLPDTLLRTLDGDPQRSVLPRTLNTRAIGTGSRSTEQRRRRQRFRERIGEKRRGDTGDKAGARREAEEGGRGRDLEEYFGACAGVRSCTSTVLLRSRWDRC